MGHRSSRNPYNVAVVAFVALGSLAFGYAASIISTTLAQPSFIAYFNMDKRSNTAAIQGAMNGLYTAGGFFGALLSSWLAERFGRKKTIFGACVTSTIGGALQAGSVDIGMFIFVRHDIGSDPAVPNRDISSAFAGDDGRFTRRFDHVISKGRPEEALKIVERLHRDETDPDDVFAYREYQQIKQQFEIDKKNEVSWKEMFVKKSYRKRLIIGFMVMFASQTTGTTVINNYGPLLYGSLGFDTSKQLLIASCWITLALVGNCFNALTLDRIGRVRALQIGWIGDLVALIGECVALSNYQQTGSQQAAIASVAFLFVHIFFFSFNVDATSYVYVGEIFPTHIRAKGMAASISGYFLSLLIYLESGPTAFANIEWKFYLVFLVGIFLFIIPTFWYYPETKGLSLEEINRLFDDEVAEVNLYDNSAVKDVGHAEEVEKKE
ncbi:hypothetical protein FQN51_005609 [Onygenales sp. PD_10]|nr:hypothetical protein FQN51_005609 [Onygenales sp. PD_10]